MGAECRGQDTHLAAGGAKRLDVKDGELDQVARRAQGRERVAPVDGRADLNDCAPVGHKGTKHTMQGMTKAGLGRRRERGTARQGVTKGWMFGGGGGVARTLQRERVDKVQRAANAVAHDERAV